MHDDHAHGRSGRANPRPLAIALAITFGFLVVEVVGGLVTGSLALLADAGHMATDVAALGLALFAIWLGRRPATPERSFGYMRAEVLAALVNAAALIAVSLLIFWEAFERLDRPPEVQGGLMLAVAVAGLLANLAAAWVLMRGGGHRHNLNTRGAFLHVIGDMLGSVGAIAAALIMLATGWYVVDPVLSALIGLLVLWGAWKLLRETLDVLLEAAPATLDIDALRAAFLTVDGVVNLHDIHAWTVTSGFVALTAHVEIEEGASWPEILDRLTRVARERFRIAHLTLQPEPAVAGDRFRGCSIDTDEGRNACLVALHDHGTHP